MLNVAPREKVGEGVYRFVGEAISIHIYIF